MRDRNDFSLGCGRTKTTFFCSETRTQSTLTEKNTLLLVSYSYKKVFCNWYVFALKYHEIRPLIKKHYFIQVTWCSDGVKVKWGMFSRNPLPRDILVFFLRKEIIGTKIKFVDNFSRYLKCPHVGSNTSKLRIRRQEYTS